MHGPAAETDDAWHGGITGENQFMYTEEQLARHFYTSVRLFNIEPTAQTTDLADYVLSFVTTAEWSCVTF